MFDPDGLWVVQYAGMQGKDGGVVVLIKGKVLGGDTLAPNVLSTTGKSKGARPDRLSKRRRNVACELSAAFQNAVDPGRLPCIRDFGWEAGRFVSAGNC
jgi:hypothetical protein